MDIFSKLAFAHPLKSKKSDEIYIATETMLCKWPKIESLSSDRGSEFKSSVFQQLIKKNGVRHFLLEGKERVQL